MNYWCSKDVDGPPVLWGPIPLVATTGGGHLDGPGWCDQALGLVCMCNIRGWLMGTASRPASDSSYMCVVMMLGFSSDEGYMVVGCCFQMGGAVKLYVEQKDRWKSLAGLVTSDQLTNVHAQLITEVPICY